MQRTELKVEKAAKKTSRELLKSVSRTKKTVLKIDGLNVMQKDTIEEERHAIRVINKFLYDCYINSWITEAEEMEDLFGDELLEPFLIRLMRMRETEETPVPDEKAGKKPKSLTPDEGATPGKKTKTQKRGAEGKLLVPGKKANYIPDEKLKREARKYVKERPIAKTVVKHFRRFRKWTQDIPKAPKQNQGRLIDWRTGEHGESGLGYSLTSTARTEADAAQAEASVSAYEEAGVEKYRYCAMLDDNTCARCKSLDGRIFKVKDKKPGVNFPIIHPNCRCYTEPVMRENQKKKIKKRAL